MIIEWIYSLTFICFELRIANPDSQDQSVEPRIMIHSKVYKLLSCGI